MCLHQILHLESTDRILKLENLKLSINILDTSGRTFQDMLIVIDFSSAATVLSVRVDVGTIIQQ